MGNNQNATQKENLRSAGVQGFLKQAISYPEMGAVLPLGIMIIVVAIVNINFFNVTNIFDILRTASFSFIIAVPVTFLTACGGIDLSIGASASLGGIVCGFCLLAGVPLPISILIALIAGGTVGLLNGVFTMKYQLPGFIATLAMQYAVNGIILVWTKGLAFSGFDSSFKWIGQTKVFGIIPMPVIYALIVGVIGHIVIRRTKFGRSILAIGGNQETAHLAGINVAVKRISIYVAVAVFAAFSGIVTASRFSTAHPTAGSGQELTIIASVIIGGSSMFGGNATIIGTACGCILLSAILNALIVMGVSTFYQNLIFGAILLISLFIDRARTRATLK